MPGALFNLLAVVALWWSTTGVIFVLGRLPRTSFRWSLAGATLLLLAGLAACAWSASRTDVAGAWAAFGGALAAWSWLETTFVLGAITGPRRAPCEPGSGPWQRFRQALQAILHHELAALALVALVVAGTSGEPDRLAAWTLLLLWGMRLSAKLNLHIGVPNVGASMLPAQLQYLAGYFRTRRPGAFYPASMALCAAAAAWLARAALDAPAESGAATGLQLLASLALLGLLEHLMLVLPMPAETFWGWLRGRRAAQRPLATVVTKP